MINIVLIGRPNVGKSTLFNALVGSRMAIEGDLPGTTRDMKIWDLKVPSDYKGPNVRVHDTPGFDAFDPETNAFSEFLQNVVTKSIELADIILFLVDKKDGVLPQDKEIAKMIRQSGKEIILVVNKCDSFLLSKEGSKNAFNDELADFLALGFDKIIGVSAVHRKGIKRLRQLVLRTLQHMDVSDVVGEEFDNGTVRPPVISLLGKPNVGKSSLFNSVLGQERVIVSDIPGTTRDSVDSVVKLGDNKYVFIDTAGIRKSAKLRDKKIERLSIMQTKRDIEKSDICLLLLDSSCKIGPEDFMVAREITKNKKSCVILITKWDEDNDALEGDLEELRDKQVKIVQTSFSFLWWAPVVFTSSVDKLNLVAVFELIDSVYVQARRRLGTGELNKWLQKVVAQKPPTGTKRVVPKINYVSQVSILPITIVFFINKTGAVHFSYRRYLENRFREDFGFGGVYLDFEFVEKKKTNYAL